MYRISSFPILTRQPFLSREPLWQSIVVAPGEYLLTGQFPDRESATSAYDRGAIIAIEFYVDQSQPYSGPLEGFSRSKAYPCFRYLRPTSATSRNIAIALRVPPGVRFMRLAFIGLSESPIASPRNLVLTPEEVEAASAPREWTRRVLVYGRVDPNLIDGSSIWLTSVADVFSRIEDTLVTILARTRVERDIVLGDVLSKEGVELCDPWKAGLPPDVFDPKSMRRLDAPAALSIMRALDSGSEIDYFVIRDNEVLALVCDDPKMAARTFAYLCYPERADLEPGGLVDRLAQNVAAILVQTDEVRSRILEARPHIDPTRIKLLAPMAPPFEAKVRELPQDRPIRLGYSGKFSREYRALETLRAFARLRNKNANVEFHVFGDKFNAVAGDPGYMDEVKRLLDQTPGVVWHGGVTRLQTLEGMRDVDIATSWRLPSMDDNPEMSTKILEYALNGLPVIMSPNVVQKRLFGDDYPGIVTSEDEFVEAFEKITSNADLYRRLSERSLQISSHFQIPKVAERMSRVVERLDKTPAEPAAKPLLVLAGHKLNFMDPILPHLEKNWSIEIDQWKNHTRHDEARSADLLSRADAIFCEWALGNAVYYSKHKLPGQRLVVRMHAQEVGLPFIDQMDFSAIDKIVTICPHYHDDLVERIKGFENRAKLVYNGFDVSDFDRPKRSGSEFTLGLIGIVPRIKGLHRAIELLEKLRRKDRRYNLRILGKKARDYDWMHARPEELAYYDEIDARIAAFGLTGSVHFDGFTDDVAGWFEGVGFILSMSDNEGSHQAVAEGMASGAIPVMRDWRGARRYYLERHVHENLTIAANAVVGFSKNARARKREMASCKKFTSRFDAPVIATALDDILAGRA